MRIIKTALFGIAMALSFVHVPAIAFAKDCGFAPQNTITIPDGSTARRDAIMKAVRDVQEYGLSVNAYLSCLDDAQEDQFISMNRDQQSRWTEDYNALLADLTALESNLNEQIRLFNTTPANPISAAGDEEDASEGDDGNS